MLRRDRLESTDAALSPSQFEGTPTSTTKAFLIFIHIPRVYRIYIANEKDADDEKEEEEKDTPSSSSTTVDEGSSSLHDTDKRQVSFASLRNEQPILHHQDSPQLSAYGRPNDLRIDEGDEKEEEENGVQHSGEQNIGYVEAKPNHRRTRTPLVEHVVTAEEMATVVKIVEKAKEGENEDNNEIDIDDDGSGKEQEEEDKTAKTSAAVNTKEPPAKTDSEIEQEENPITSVMKTFFGVITNNDHQVTTRLSREQAIQAIKDQPSMANLPSSTGGTGASKTKSTTPATMKDPNRPEPNTEIRVFALLQITCRNLYNEGCFYTTATVTSITKGVEGDEWNQFTIMCKPKSIGLVLERLERIGVGSSVGMISIYKPELLRTADLSENTPELADPSGRNNNNNEERPNLEAARAEWKNAASRLRIEQVKEQIHEQAVGIAVVPSPVRMVQLRFGSSFSAGVEDWPTPEMASRGDIIGLITGIAIAFPSGMGVALSILGNNTASLVGVAISASLLPPAVNAGVCWAHAILIRFDIVSNPGDFERIGGISFALTIINILCIWVSGMIMFAIKEVAPSESKSAFWSRDIKVARATQKRHGRKKSQVDLDAIKEGLQEALARKRDANGNVVVKDKFMKQWFKNHKPADFSFSIADESNMEDDEEFLESFMMGLNPIVEGAQSLEPADRASYLGFRASKQDFEVDDDDPVPELKAPGWFSFFERTETP
eukprot:scaffold2177_cov115-Cylindrotheca_fusiformis.AAC.9